MQSLNSTCAPLYSECTGGKTCCGVDLECVKLNDYYSQCLNKPGTASCVPAYSQCGGKEHRGGTSCCQGSTCQRFDDYFSQCVPDKNAPSEPSFSTSTSCTLHLTSTAAPTPTAYSMSSSTHEKGVSSYTSLVTQVPSITVSSVHSTNEMTKSTTLQSTQKPSITYSSQTTSSSPAQSSSSSSPSQTYTASNAATTSSSAATKPTSSPLPSGKDPKELYPSKGPLKKAPTTRYWDCCVPNYAQATFGSVRVCDKSGSNSQPNTMGNVCQGGSGTTCNDHQPWAVTENLSFGFAAQNAAKPCECYRLDFSNSKSMVVQVTNTGDMAHPEQFDLMIPGGGTGAFPQGCMSQWGSGQWQDNPYGGVIKKRADCDSTGVPDALKPGCYWRFDWLGGVDNPEVDYSLVECPKEILEKSQCHPK